MATPPTPIQSQETAVAAAKDTLKRLEETVERITGQTADALRRQTLGQLRRATELKTNRKWVFASRFPLIGRGSVMRDRIIDHDTIEMLLEKSLR